MLKIINRIIYIFLYIVFFIIIFNFFGNYLKNLLFLQFTDNKRIIGKIADFEYNPVPSLGSSYTIHYTFSYIGKKYNTSFGKFVIIYDIYSLLENDPYKTGKSVLVLYNPVLA